MRVLSVISAYPPYLSGGPLHAHQLNAGLRRAGLDVEVATLWDSTRTDWLRGSTVAAPPPRPLVERDGVPVHRLGLELPDRLRSLPWALTYYAAMRAARRHLTGLFIDEADALVERVRPDVLHLSRVGREWFYEAFLRAAATRGIPFVLTANHHPHWGFRRRDRWWNSIYRRADVVLVLSHHEGRQVEQLGVDSSRIIRTVIGIVGNPTVDPSARVPPAPEVLHLGQVKRYKGVDVTFEALGKCVWPDRPDVRFTVAGPWVGRLWSLRRRLERHPSVDVLDAVSDEDKWQLLARAIVLCVPSTEEALGGVYLEAWRSGTATIGADIPTVAELFQGTGGGLAVPPRASEVGHALQRILDDDDLRRSLARSGLEAVEREYNWDRAVEIARQAYAQVVAG